MSYEGYEQVLCANGHYWIEDATTVMYVGYSPCEICKEKPVWYNPVDQTNCDPEVEKAMRVELVENTPAQTKKCGECDREDLLEVQTYVIPTDKGHKVDFSNPFTYMKEG